MAVPTGHAPYTHPSNMPPQAYAGDGDQEELYNKLVRLRDDVLEGKHPDFKLPPTAIEQLKSQMTAFAANDSLIRPTRNSSLALPGLSPYRTASNTPAALLKKSPALIEAEARLERTRKRARIERDMKILVDQRKPHGKEHVPVEFGPADLDATGIVLEAWQNVLPVSGLKASSYSGSSFDENDYYSSQVQSEWSPSADYSPPSDVGAVAPLDARPPQTSPSAAQSGLGVSRHAPVNQFAPKVAADQGSANYVEGDDGDDEDDDDEYDPPEASAFDSYQGAVDVDGDEDDSEYEPGPVAAGFKPTGPSPQVPVIHNRLTHLAAPQPNRISPFATAKGPSMELDFANNNRAGQPATAHDQSRASTMSPTNPSLQPRKFGMRGTRGTKKSGKKRKLGRESDTVQPTKKRRELPNERTKMQPVSVANNNGSFARPDPYYSQLPQYHGAEAMAVDAHHSEQALHSRLRYAEYQPASSQTGYVPSPSAARYAQRPTTDLRRVASQQQARPPFSPDQRAYTPTAPYQAVRQSVEHLQYASGGRAAAQPPAQRYEIPPSPSVMAPPPPAFVVDQDGNRYYAAGPAGPAEAVPLPTPSRASVAPTPYDRAPSRAAFSYEAFNDSMPPPPAPARYSGVAQRDASYRYESQPAQAAVPAREQTSPVYAPLRSYSVRPDAMSGNPAGYGRQSSAAPVQYAPAPRSARAASVMPPGEMSGHEAQTTRQNYNYPPAAQAVRYVDQYGNEVFPQEVRQVSEYGYQ